MLLMLNFHNIHDNKLNIGFGLNYLYGTVEEWHGRLLHALNVSYRYQPDEGGIFVSFGASYIFACPGVNIGVGYVF